MNEHIESGSNERRQDSGSVWRVLAIAFGILAVLQMMVLCFIAGFATHYLLSRLGERSVQQCPAFEQPAPPAAGHAPAVEDPAFGNVRPDEKQSPAPAPEAPAEEAPEEEEEYIPRSTDTYYKKIANAIDENVSYRFHSKSYTNSDEKNGVDIIANYYEITDSNIPNIDKINEQIKNAAMYYAEEFPKNSKLAEYTDSYTAYITAYVTYNDEDVISIVFDEYVSFPGAYFVDLLPMNIDVRNGVILDNTGILSVDDRFAADFKERCVRQNGELEVVSKSTDRQIRDYLTDPSTLIAFYTPLGMEVGINYANLENSGWVTVTYKDYQKFISRS
ncbi:MAG: DUF4163 domain-containing protein [Lachnospiraceae bacterium]|nr:DUF4163 domain-containing protein [Lachnospiraceae bacterium]